MLTLGIFFDQLANAARLHASGTSLSLPKFTFTSLEILTDLRTLLTSSSIALNVLRMQRIAHVASRRKHHAADLVEEYMYDTELRFDWEAGRELRPAHLQTADMRMSVWRGRNWDLRAVKMLGVTGLVGGMWVVGRWTAWIWRTAVLRRGVLGLNGRGE